MADTKYVLDADVLVTAARDYFAFDLVPDFWHALEAHANVDRVCSIDEIRQRELKHPDKLRDWARSSFSAAFRSTADDVVIAAYADIARWARRRQAVQGPRRERESRAAHLAKFLDGADGWLIAFAKAYHHTVVTLESKSGEGAYEIKIPNVCEAFDVPWCRTWDMMRDLGIVLSS